MWILSDEKIMKKLGKYIHVRNGVGYGFISDEYLYHNGFLEIGIGRIKSGWGDWGGGFEYATDCVLKITIDRDFRIMKTETSSFYNNRDSQIIERKAKKICKKLKLHKKFRIKDEMLKHHISEIFKVIPCKRHIGHKVFGSPHMLEYFTTDTDGYNFDDAKCLTKKGE